MRADLLLSADDKCRDLCVNKGTVASISEYQSDEKGRPRSAAEIVTGGGTRIYLLPVETFARHLNNLYLIAGPIA